MSEQEVKWDLDILTSDIIILLISIQFTLCVFISYLPKKKNRKLLLPFSVVLAFVYICHFFFKQIWCVFFLLSIHKARVTDSLENRAYSVCKCPDEYLFWQSKEIINWILKYAMCLVLELMELSLKSMCIWFYQVFKKFVFFPFIISIYIPLTLSFPSCKNFDEEFSLRRPSCCLHLPYPITVLFVSIDAFCVVVWVFRRATEEDFFLNLGTWIK